MFSSWNLKRTRLWQWKLILWTRLAEDRVGRYGNCCASEHCAGYMAFPHRFQRENCTRISWHFEKSFSNQSVKCFCCLPHHLHEAPYLEGTGCVRVHVCACECVAAQKMLGVCAKLCGANWHQEGTYAKSRSTWPLNLDKLSISCAEGASFLHALV